MCSVVRRMGYGETVTSGRAGGMLAHLACLGSLFFLDRSVLSCVPAAVPALLAACSTTGVHSPGPAVAAPSRPVQARASAGCLSTSSEAAYHPSSPAAAPPASSGGSWAQSRERVAAPGHPASPTYPPLSELALPPVLSGLLAPLYSA